MKVFFIISMSVFLIFGSCSPHNNCVSISTDKEAAQKIHSKRYKAALIERDSLCHLAFQLQMDTTLDGEQIRTLQRRLEDKNKQYNQLKDLNGEQLATLSEELNRKQKELSEKEKLLASKDQRLKDLEKLVKERDEMLASIMGVLRQALDAFPKDELSIEIKGGKIYISMMDKLLFKSGSAKVEPRGVEALSKLSTVLINYPDIELNIEGHTDNVPIKTNLFKDNWDLSTYRATSVLRILLDNKMSESQLTASGKGEFSPIANNETNEGRALNRRTELILTPRLDALFILLGK